MSVLSRPTARGRRGRPPRMPLNSYFFPVSPHASATSVALGVGNLRALPWLVDQPLSIWRMGAEVTVAGEAGAHLRLGIYADTGQGGPGALLVDVGQLDAATTGRKRADFATLRLNPGVVWLAAVVQDVVTTQPTVGTVTQWEPQILIPSATEPIANAAAVGVVASGVTAALPTTFPAFSSSGLAVRPYLRVI